MIIETLSINDFINAWFNDDFSKLSKDDFEKAYCEYMDASGLYKTRNFADMAHVNYLSLRCMYMKFAINSQKDFVNLFGHPYEKGFEFFAKFKYKLVWNGKIDDFLILLRKIEAKEAKFNTELSIKQKQINAERAKPKPQGKSRQDFIRNINILRKNGYVIDRQTTTVEEFALIIKDSIEEYEAIKSIK